MLDGMTNIKASEVLKELKDYTEDLPHYSPDEVAETLEMAIKALEQQPSEDCISRKQALDDKGLAVFHRYDDYVKMRNYLKALPSVTPQRKRGKWIFREDMGHQYCCSECGCPKPFVNDYYYKKIIGCPYCLTDMSGGGEDEDRKSL